MSTPGADGRHKRRPTMITRDPAPMASAAGTVSPSRIPVTYDPAWATSPSPSALKPNSLGSWLTITMIAIPFR